MIKLFHAENFGCLKNVEFELTPLHAFIGPNDSGKSTLLKAIDCIGQHAFPQPRQGNTYSTYIPERPNHVTLRAASTRGVVHRAMGPRGMLGVDSPHERSKGFSRLDPLVREEERTSFVNQLAHTRVARFDPVALRKASSLVRLDDPESFFQERGKGLSGIIGSIYLRGDEEPIASMRREVQRLFPSVQRIGPVSINSELVELEAILSDGTKVRAPDMSEGLLYYLAFYVLQYLESVSILLIEEPENGLHPSRIADVIRVLRDLTETKGLQVIMSTHNPLVINELKPEEVSIVTRPNAEQGTVVTPMIKTPNFEARFKSMNLGELWLSYANGKDEADLLNEPPGLASKK